MRGKNVCVGDGCDLLVAIRVSHQPARPVTPIPVMGSRLAFAPCQPSPHLKPAFGLTSSLPPLLFSLVSHRRTSSIPLNSSVNPPNSLAPHSHTPTLHPFSTPLEPLTSKACQLNMSLIRAGGACAAWKWGAEVVKVVVVGAFLQLSLVGNHTQYETIKKALRYPIHIHYGPAMSSLVHNIPLLFNYEP